MNSKARGFGIVVNQDLYRQTLQEIVDTLHPLVVLAVLISWAELGTRIEPVIVRNLRSSRYFPQDDLFAPSPQIAGVRGGGRPRPRLPRHLMLSLLYINHAFNESDESLCAPWADQQPFHLNLEGPLWVVRSRY